MSAKEYLWDKKGEGDAETKQLEALLGQAAFKGGEFPERSRGARRWPFLVAGLAAAAAIAFALVPRGPFFEATGGARLYAGRWFEPAEATQVKVADIGVLDVQKGAKVRLVRTGAQEHRMELARGAVHARVDAPPRLFVIDTPTATAVDLGCEYDLVVAPDGAATLDVHTGWVSLEGQGKQSIVPAGMGAVTRSGSGPGMPVAAKASAELRAAVDRFDRGEAVAAEKILARAQLADAITVWHLLLRVPAAQREAVAARLDALVASPMDKAKAVALEKPALEAWWDAITAGTQ